MPSEQSFISLIGIQYTEVVDRELKELYQKKEKKKGFICLIKHCCRTLYFCSECGQAQKEKISSPVFNILLIKIPQSFFAFSKWGTVSLIQKSLLSFWPLQQFSHDSNSDISTISILYPNGGFQASLIVQTGAVKAYTIPLRLS